MTSSYATSYDIGLIAAAPTESSVKITPKIHAGTKPGAMYIHGAGSNSDYCIVPTANQSLLTQAVTGAGYYGWSHDNGGVATWGNDLSIGRISAGWTVQKGAMPVDNNKVVLISASMGGLNALAWAAQNASKVACIVSVIPVINLTDIHTNNRGGYAASINSAYGGAYSQATYGATHNPMTMATAGAFNGIPMLFYYGLTDTLCLPAETQAFAAAVGPSVQLISVPSGHDLTSYGSVDPAVVTSFIQANT